MSHQKETDFLSVSSRIRALENHLLSRERMNQMIEAKDSSEALKLLTECGYDDSLGLDGALDKARADTFQDMVESVPDPKLVEIFQIKYDYHNAKTIMKALPVGADPQRLFLPGGRYDPNRLFENWKKNELNEYTSTFEASVRQAEELLAEQNDPQKSDLILDRACFEEMAQLANDLDSQYLQGYVRLSVDAANLRIAVRLARIGKDSDVIRQTLIPNGDILIESIASVQGAGLADVFRQSPLAQAAVLGAELAHPGGGTMTAFERECDNALTAYLASAQLTPFGEEVVLGYLYAKELEMTAIRTIFAGRAAGLSADTIRQRLRATYA